MKPNPDGNWIAGEDFDRVTAERDAALVELSEIKESMAYRGSLLCRIEGKRDTLQLRLTAADERADALEGLLRLARQFVTNGVELGYITMPDPETADAAHDLVPMIDAALKPAEPAKCNACGGRGSVCVDWDSGAWADCQKCTKS